MCVTPSHGGSRIGSGRPNLKQKGYQGSRLKLVPGKPLYLELVLRKDIFNLRKKHILSCLRKAIIAAQNFNFRVIHFSVCKNTILVIAETPSNKSLESGMKCLSIRLAKYINKQFRQRLHQLRKGAVFNGRYRLKILRNILEAKNYLDKTFFGASRSFKLKKALDPFSTASFANRKARIFSNILTTTRKMSRCPEMSHAFCSPPRYQLLRFWLD